MNNICVVIENVSLIYKKTAQTLFYAVLCSALFLNSMCGTYMYVYDNDSIVKLTVSGTGYCPILTHTHLQKPQQED